MSSTGFNKIHFDMSKNKSNVIKVIGVGGGGSNAVNHMFSQGIKGVDFVICNTDAQALQNSSVPNKVQLGVGLTEGLGAGANPEVGKRAAEENVQEIKEMLSSNTKMVFITAGMGGGTGTGAAPVIAKIARELDLLTIGIVTIPFKFEGKVRREQAQKGIEEMSEYVDSMIVINNNKLRDVYGNLGFKAGFAKADEVLSTASRGIAEVITHHYTQNIDLRDAKTVLANSGTAIMGSAAATGENRAKEAVAKALDSPLLNDNKITGAKNVLLLIVSGSEEITIDEIGEINDYIRSEAKTDANKTDVNIIMGVGENEELGGAVAVTIIATGFNKEQQCQMTKVSSKKVIHVLETEQQVTFDFSKNKNTVNRTDKPIEGDLFVSKDEKEETQLEEVDTENMEVTANIEEDNQVEAVEIVDEFEITTIKPSENEEVEEDDKPATSLLFDFSISEVKQNKISDQEEKEEEIQPKNNNNSTDKEIVYTLSEYMEVEEQLTKATPKTVKKEKKNEIDEALQFTLKIEEEENEYEVVDNENAEQIEESFHKAKKMSPFDVGISELKKTAAERKETLKNFNYKFLKKATGQRTFDEYENQPAYKRMGMELDDVQSVHKSNKSRTTLNIDDDNDINLRSNNSFLHDNVD